ncbi:hypothetical protein MLD38_003170 [Melastoma candidum]|uniref:Uncharacterized protein n=1 Tax=Melastoma candidum TaxID=119954 RepID=A0ACB9S187_9MYRT|nr:hypothetical protein MLD38_003170 [Melastoma candidum]
MDAETHDRITSRGISYGEWAFSVVNTLLCIFFCIVASGPSSVLSVPGKSHGNYPSGPLKDNHVSASPNAMFNHHDASYPPENLEVLTACGNLGKNSEMFCFPSTLRGISSERHNNVEVTSLAKSFNDHMLIEVGAGQPTLRSSWSWDHGMSILVDGRTVMCTLNSVENIDEFSYIRGNHSSTAYQNDISSCRGPILNQNSATFSTEDTEIPKSVPDVEISPPVLDWGETYLYSPSLDFITLTNNLKDSSLRVHQPVSMDTQFFPCNFTEVVLGPGEVLSICFMFLPKSLGSSSTHLILQTSSGGFLLQAKGYATDSPYGIQPLLGLNVSSGGSWRKDLSLSNPFDESIQVEELTIWLSVGKDAHQVEATCSLQEFSGARDLSMVVQDWYLVRMNPCESSLQMALRLHRNWEVSAKSSENIFDLDISFSSSGTVLGALCMQLTRLSQHTADVIMIPIEAEIDITPTMNDATTFIMVSLERVENSEPGCGSVAISLRNSGRSVLKVHEISESAGSGIFHIKQTGGLLLFPGTVTRVAIVACTHCSGEALESAQEMTKVDKNCKLLVQTNDSMTSRTEIPCLDIIHVCRGGNSQFEYSKLLINRMGHEGEQTVSVDHTSAFKALETAYLDELVVLRNWKSQGSDIDSSVLDEDEVFFPTIAVGTHHSKWITAHNPSHQPVIMQLLLNTGEIIDKCRDEIDGLAELVYSGRSLPSKSAIRIQDGFSLAENAITEAIVQPFSKVSLGPLIFHPLQRCEWRSSVLVRNNLSGVEWLLVHGSGGLRALTISESAKPAQEIEFDLESSDTIDLDLSSTKSCSRPLMKVLRIMNSGDLTLEVRSIRISGTDCELDGFVVHNCLHFSLRPGESTELKVSYQSKYSASFVRRDLELALASGIFVLPLRATIPIKVTKECRRSIFWSRAKKIFKAILVVAPCGFFVFCCFYPQAFGLCAPPYCFCRSNEETIPATAHKVAKSSKGQHSKKYSKLMSSTKAKQHLPSTAIDEKSLLLRLDDDVNDGSGELRIQRMDTQSGLEKSGTVLLTTEKPAEQEKSPSNMGDVINSNAEGPTLPSNLTVIIGNEKGRRRRKRKGAGSGLSALIDVSSSHSGNSTPSPLSPVSSTTLSPQRTWPKLNDVEQCLETKIHKPPTPEPVKNICSHKPVITLDQPSVPPPTARPRTVLKPVLQPSATFPCSSNQLLSRARLAPHSRAPGSRLCSERVHAMEENPKKASVGVTELTYSIWGDHFSVIDLIDKGGLMDDDNTVSLSGGMVDVDSASGDSFFVRGPPALLTEYEPEQPSTYNEK